MQPDRFNTRRAVVEVKRDTRAVCAAYASERHSDFKHFGEKSVSEVRNWVSMSRRR